MSFDSTAYDTLPQTNVAGTLALIRAAITASKPVSDPAAKKALKRVRTAGEALRSLHQAVPPAKSESVTRAADSSMDRIWNAVEQRLRAHVELGDADGAEAEQIHALLFPKGMSFLAFKYAEQWAEGEAVLGRVAAQDLDGSLERLVGAPFLKALRERHAAYGEALGITKAKPLDADAASLLEPLRSARSALSIYVRVVVAAVENEELDAGAATSALAPLAELRQSLRASKKKGGVGPAVATGEPVEPLPPVE